MPNTLKTEIVTFPLRPKSKKIQKTKKQTKFDNSGITHISSKDYDYLSRNLKEGLLYCVKPFSLALEAEERIRRIQKVFK